MAPAFSNCSTTVALNGLENSFKISEAHVVEKSRVQILSLIEINRPSALDLGFPGKRNQYVAAIVTIGP